MIKSNFKYVLEGAPIDFFFSTFSKEQLILTYKEETVRYGGIVDTFEKELESNYAFVQATVKASSGEMPHTIRYFSIPRYDYCDMEICALAKIDNNGTTFMFTNDLEFAKFISGSSGYSFDISKI